MNIFYSFRATRGKIVGPAVSKSKGVLMMVGGIKGNGISEVLQYIHRLTTKTTVEITDDSSGSSTSGSMPQSGIFFWKQIFVEIDVNGDGIINKGELAAGVTESGATQELFRLFESLDSEDTGAVSTQEQNVQSAAGQADDSRFDLFFRTIDSNQDGSLSETELADAKAQILKRIENSEKLLKDKLTEAFLNMLETAGSLGPEGGVPAGKNYPSVAQFNSEEADRIYHKTDANLDGEVSRDELEKALSEMRERNK
jgi:Ca2+-binding EF-hand superfamily protein